MKDFFNRLLSLLMFIVAILLFYVAATFVFYSSVVNIIVFVIAIFVLLQGCGNIDKTHKFGKYAAEPETKNDVDKDHINHHAGPDVHPIEHTKTDM